MEECPWVFAPEVKSPRQRLKLWHILRDPAAPHRDRLWFAGFLLAAGMDISRVLDLIVQFRAWQNFDLAITAYQLASVERCRSGVKQLKVEVERVERRAETSPWRGPLNSSPPPQARPKAARSPHAGAYRLIRTPADLERLLDESEEPAGAGGPEEVENGN